MIQVSRPEFTRILEILSARGLLSKFGSTLSIFEITGEPRLAIGAGSPSRGTVDAIQNAISSYIQDVTQQINNMTTSISQTSVILSSEAGVSVQEASVSFTASGGIYSSLNLHNGNYVLPTPYTTIARGSSTSPLPSVGFSIGGNIGLGDTFAFSGKSSVATLGPFSVTYNESYVSLGVNVTATLGLPGGTFTDQSHTTVYNQQIGNAFEDLRSVENALWNMSQDPFLGNFR